MLNLLAEIFITRSVTEQAASEGEIAVMTDKLSQFWQRTDSSDRAMLTL
jgi:hypothetical protein